MDNNQKLLYIYVYISEYRIYFYTDDICCPDNSPIAHCPAHNSQRAVRQQSLVSCACCMQHCLAAALFLSSPLLFSTLLLIMLMSFWVVSSPGRSLSYYQQPHLATWAIIIMKNFFLSLSFIFPLHFRVCILGKCLAWPWG